MSDIQARGGISLLVKMLACGNTKLIEVTLIAMLDKVKTIEVSTHPF